MMSENRHPTTGPILAPSPCLSSRGSPFPSLGSALWLLVESSPPLAPFLPQQSRQCSLKPCFPPIPFLHHGRRLMLSQSSMSIFPVGMVFSLGFGRCYSMILTLGVSSENRSISLTAIFSCKKDLSFLPLNLLGLFFQL